MSAPTPISLYNKESTLYDKASGWYQLGGPHFVLFSWYLILLLLLFKADLIRFFANGGDRKLPLISKFV